MIASGFSPRERMLRRTGVYFELNAKPQPRPFDRAELPRGNIEGRASRAPMSQTTLPGCTSSCDSAMSSPHLGLRDQAILGSALDEHIVRVAEGAN